MDWVHSCFATVGGLLYDYIHAERGGRGVRGKDIHLVCSGTLTCTVYIYLMHSHMQVYNRVDFFW